MGWDLLKLKVPSEKSRDYRTFISNHHKEIEDTYATSKAVQLKVQGQWIRWLNYIQKNISWKSLLAMPVNLTYMSSTYDTLLSPSNLKGQGRLTFHHDNVLRIIISNIRSSIKNIKSSVPTSMQPIKIKFVKKGTRVKKQNSYPSRILHQASGWFFLRDLDGTFLFHLT